MPGSLAIVIPTHNRHDILKDVAGKLNRYFTGKCSFRIFVLDSSQDPLESLGNAFINYIHCPGISATEKGAYFAELIAPNYQDIKWILFTPDDDLFIPSDETVRQLFADTPLQASRYIYIPSRYIMFKTDQPNKNSVLLQECWSHHCNIAKTGFTPRERIERFSSEGVASYWGLYSIEGFSIISRFRLDLFSLLPRNCISIIEDLSNILVLSFNWSALQHPLICLRGDDRRFQKSKSWIPSWIVFNMLNEKTNKDLLLEILNCLRNAIREVLWQSNSSDSVPDNNDCAMFIKLHVDGYKEGRSRLYNLNSPLVMQKLKCPSISFYNPPLISTLILSRRRHNYVTIPSNRTDLETSLYPESLLFGDKRVIDAIYDNKSFFFANRES
jgi:hypothetical protein